MSYLQQRRRSIMQNGKSNGYMRTVSGYPLTLTDCLGGRLIDYKIYGNCVQGGTPTPDTPISVQSVGDYDSQSGKYQIPVTVSGDNNTGIYNIYLDEPLRGIGGNSDYIEVDCSRRVATRTSNIRKILVDGRYQLGSVYRINTNTIRISLGDSYVGRYPTISSSKMLSDKLVYRSDWFDDNETVFIQSSIPTRPFISLKKDRFGYEEGDSNSVIQQKIRNYLIANPIEMYYQLANPVVTDITNQINWNDIPMLYEGTNIISSGTTVPPSNMEVSYYSDVEEENNAI